MKSDVKEAFVNFVKCRWRTANAIYVEERRLRRLGMRKSEITKRITMLKYPHDYPHDLPRQRADFTFADEENQNNNDEPDDNAVVNSTAKSTSDPPQPKIAIDEDDDVPLLDDSEGSEINT